MAYVPPDQLERLLSAQQQQQQQQQGHNSPAGAQTQGVEAQPPDEEDEDAADVHLYLLFHATPAEMEQVKRMVHCDREEFSWCKVAVHQWQNAEREASDAEMERLQLSAQCQVLVDRAALQSDLFLITQLFSFKAGLRTRGRLQGAGIVPAVVNVQEGNMELYEFLQDYPRYKAQLEFDHDEEDEADEEAGADEAANAGAGSSADGVAKD